MSAAAWWQEGVLWRVDPGAAAGGGEADGELGGVRAGLADLEWLGVDGICVGGRLVADPVPGLEELVADAGRRGISVLLDLAEAGPGERLDAVLRSWMDRGVAGFRLDLAPVLAEEAAGERRDGRNGSAPAGSRVPELLRRLAVAADGAAAPVLVVGDACVLGASDLAALAGTEEEGLRLACTASFAEAELRADPLRAIVEKLEARLPEAAWPAWTGSGHGSAAVAGRWADLGRKRRRVALMLLLTLRGTPILQAGDGPALPPAGRREDPGSVAHLVRDLIGLRRDESDLHRGEYASLPSPAGAWAYRRGDGHLVALNLSGAPVAVEGLTGRVLICTQRGRDGERVRGTLVLRPWEGAVLAAG